MWFSMKASLLWSILVFIPVIINAQSLEDLLKRHPELSEFLELVRSSPFVNASLPWRSLTLFAPTNTAIRDHLNRAKIDNYTVTYHLVNVAKKTTELEEFISTELSGNPPIWITRTARNEIFLNDAKIEQQRKDFLVKNARGMDQILHIIDRVLEPTVPDSSDSSLINPDAKKFLERSSSYNITGQHSITNFAGKVKQLGKLDMFRTLGRHTFFIPVDEAFKRIQLNTVDAKVIDGHVIPNHVIFLRPAELRRQYETAAFSSSLPVFVEFDRPENSDGRWIVRSDTRSADGDAFHRKGVVQTEVVRGNIPVKNGVVHLISKPLVVIDSTVFDTMAGENLSNAGTNEKENGPTYEFYKLIKDYASDELKSLLRTPGPEGITVFVPSNEALRSPTLNIIKSNRTQLDEILKLHIVLRTVTSDNITETNEGFIRYSDVPVFTGMRQIYSMGSPLLRTPFQIQTALRNKKLFFNYILDEGRRTLYVEGGGVNATITQPDVGATNGVIHMIDRILGYADQDIYEKLRTDPMLQTTFSLSSQDDFNHQFKDINKRYTLFAPSNLAWEKIYRIAPSEYKKLQMGNFGYHVSRIIQRHTIVNRVYTIEQLRELSTNASEQAYPIQAVHGLLKVIHREDVDRMGRDRYNRHYGISSNNLEGDYYSAYDYTVSWANERAQVIRPNIICTNGIIHIIDTVLMKPDDVTVTYTAAASMPSPGTSSIYVIPSFSLLLILLNLFTGLL